MLLHMNMTRREIVKMKLLKFLFRQRVQIFKLLFDIHLVRRLYQFNKKINILITLSYLLIYLKEIGIMQSLTSPS